MSTRTITAKFFNGATPIDMAAVIFNDPTGTFGVRRTDTSAVVIAAGTPLDHTSTGVYSKTFTQPALGLTYEYWVQYTTPKGATQRFQRLVTDSTASLMPVYLAPDGATTLLAQLPSTECPAYRGAIAQDQSSSLVLATSDIDQGMRYQGRKFDPQQPLQFPRMAYEAAGRVRNYGSIPQLVLPPAYGDVVWDWDASNQVAIVPQNVLLAVLYQADSILAASREERLGELHDGVRQHSNSGLSETYDASSPGNRTGLCRRAWQLLKNYQLVAGRVL